MPLVNVSLRAGKPPSHRQAILDGIYRALRETFDVPEDDQFMTIREHGDGDLRYGATYLDIARTDDVVLVQITANDTRTREQKKALFARIAALLHERPGLRPEDVFVSLVEVPRENWSLGNGLAQYA